METLSAEISKDPYKNKLDWATLEVGKQYCYEEKYHIQGTVTVLEDNSDDEYEKFTIRLDDQTGGMSTMQDDFTFQVSRLRNDRSLDHYISNSFRPVGAQCEYVSWADQARFRNEYLQNHPEVADDEEHNE